MEQNERKPFDGIAYFHNLANQNRLARSKGFFPCTCSGIASLEDVLTSFQTQHSFICVEDTNDSSTEEIDGGWFVKRVFTVFIICRYRFSDMTDRQAKLETCRAIFHQFHSRMIRDRESFTNLGMTYLNVERVTSRELGEYFLNGCTGLYFITDILEPTNLCYNEKEWEYKP